MSLAITGPIRSGLELGTCTFMGHVRAHLVESRITEMIDALDHRRANDVPGHLVVLPRSWPMNRGRNWAGHGSDRFACDYALESSQNSATAVGPATSDKCPLFWHSRPEPKVYRGYILREYLNDLSGSG